MSDHGTDNDVKKEFSVENLYHVVFSISGRSINSKQVIEKAVGLNEFSILINKLIKDRAEEICDDAFLGYVKIQREDPYGKLVNKRPETQILQTRGVVSKDDAYVHIVTGEEYYYRGKNEEDNLINDPHYEVRISELKDIAGNRFIDIYKEKRFKPTRKLYKKWKLKRAEDIEFLE